MRPKPTRPSVAPWSPAPSMKSRSQSQARPERTNRSPSPSRRVIIEDQGHGEVGGGVGEDAGRVGDHHPAPRGRGQVDVVVAHGDVGHDPQGRTGGVEEGVVDPVVQQGHDGAGAGDGLVQLVAAQRTVVRRDPELAGLAEQLEGGFGQPPRGHDPGHRETVLNLWGGDPAGRLS